MSFIHDDFLLQSATARRLYHGVAADLPIIDFHCHLPPQEIADDRRFPDLFSIWLAGDHYKWRAMRADGVAEKFCTGEATPREKFDAWCATVPHTLRNPLYHWSHLELKRYFGFDRLISPSTADAIWDLAAERLATPEFSTRGILEKCRVQIVCTTDDPTDDLAAHRRIAEAGGATRVYPTFRPDKALRVDDPAIFGPWCDLLAARSGVDTGSFAGLLDALRQRHDAFHAIGGRMSDHGLEICYADFCSEAEAIAIFDRARSGQAASPEQHRKFASFLMVYFGRLDAEKGWTKQLHFGARRNNNTRAMRAIGPDTGFDGIGDWPQVDALGRYLDALDSEGALPRMVLYNLNPADNYAVSTMAGCFQGDGIPGKIQFGSGWWFLDQKEGIELQLNALSNTGLLSRFVGMLTDSRSFMSFPRHEYFRRILCQTIGADVEAGLIPDDHELQAGLVRAVCYDNARDFFGLTLPGN